MTWFGGISRNGEKWVDQRVIEEVESMELKGCLGKVFKDECQVSGFVPWVNCQTDFNPSPWN